MKWVKINEVRYNDKNPRVIRDDKFAKLKRSIIEFPEMLEKRPLVCVTRDDGKLMVLGGNMRLKALNDIGAAEVPVILADDWTEEQRARFLIADNVGFGEWDWDELANEWNADDLEKWGLDLPEMKVEAEAEEDNYEMPDEVQTDIVMGDLFEIGEHRLLCGDSTDSDQVAKLMNGQKADMIFTDPPYGMAYESNAWDSKKQEVKQKRTDTQILNDENTTVGKNALNLIPLFLNTDRHFYIWCRWDCFNDFKEVCENIGKIKSVIVWDKGGPGLGDLKGSYGDSEWAIFGMIGRRELKERQNGVWQVNRMKGLQMQHPTQKPLEICERGINNSTNMNEFILDFFLGSGSTMAASHQLKRKCYGMELEPKYCQVIIDRMLKLDPTLEVKRNGQPYLK